MEVEELEPFLEELEPLLVELESFSGRGRTFGGRGRPSGGLLSTARAVLECYLFAARKDIHNDSVTRRDMSKTTALNNNKSEIFIF